MCLVWQNEDFEYLNRIRLFVYHFFVDHTRAPTALDIAGEFKIEKDEAIDCLQQLAEAHVLHINADSSEIIMAHPFSGVETGFKVISGAKAWFANCIWDALGIPAMLKKDCKIITRCGDCGEIKILAVEKGLLQPTDDVIHFAVPAKKWWDDIVFT